MQKIKLRRGEPGMYDWPMTIKYDGDVGLDIDAGQNARLEPLVPEVITSLLYVEHCPRQYWLQILGKSGLDFVVLGGVIDAGYTGPILVKVVAFEETVIMHGDAITQLVVRPRLCHTRHTRVNGMRVRARRGRRGGKGGIVAQRDADGA